MHLAFGSLVEANVANLLRHILGQEALTNYIINVIQPRCIWIEKMIGSKLGRSYVEFSAVAGQPYIGAATGCTYIWLAGMVVVYSMNTV